MNFRINALLVTLKKKPLIPVLTDVFKIITLMIGLNDKTPV